MTQPRVESQSHDGRPQRLWLPALVWGLCLIWFNIGPINMQWLDQGPKPLRWQFQLYHGFGGNVCDLRYYAPSDEGELVYLERWKTLGFETHSDLPKKLRRIGPKQLAGHHRRVCAARRRELGRKAELFAVVQCRSDDWDGWELIESMRGRRRRPGAGSTRRA